VITKIRIEKLDANMEEVTIGEWLKAEGDWIEAGEPLVEIITDKVTFELEAAASGTLRQIVAARNSTVPVGYIIALIGDEAEELPDAAAENQSLLEKLSAAQAAASPAAVSRRPFGPLKLERSSRVRATPAARRLAKERGVDLADITPSDGQAVTEQDVEAYLEREG